MQIIALRLARNDCQPLNRSENGAGTRGGGDDHCSNPPRLSTDLVSVLDSVVDPRCDDCATLVEPHFLVLLGLSIEISKSMISFLRYPRTG
mmetsp:Transcript_9676/g.19748  ORF Transcript_9676/g.19748 Transcript_9676/m.19748 type:complete len:91 (+) Transcript_9676:841-1113(+)